MAMGILNEPRAVFTSVPGGRAVVGRPLPFLATFPALVRYGQVTHPCLLQISIEPSLLTDHEQRAPLAVLSMQRPTAVLPSIAKTVDVIANTTTQHRVREARENILSSCFVQLAKR